MDFSDDLIAGETLTDAVASSEIVTGPDALLTIESATYTDSTVILEVAGGTVGETYKVTVTTPTSVNTAIYGEGFITVE